MLLIDQIVEQRIAEAIERGELDHLPGAGRPLQLDDDRHVPPELRTAHRLLKNAGFVPPEVELRREIARAEDLLVTARTEDSRAKAARRLDYLTLRLNAARRDRMDLRTREGYYQKLQSRLSRDDGV